MTFATLICRNLLFRWRVHLAMAAATAVATAVIVGSLTIGVSARASLRTLALRRLGPVSAALLAPAYVREQLAAAVGPDCAPAILLRGQARKPNARARLPRVQILAWPASAALPLAPEPFSGPNQADVNAPLAEDLGLRPGDTILVDCPADLLAPAATAFAHRARKGTVKTLRLRVRRILEDDGWARFSLQADEFRPRNLFVSLPWLQQQLDLGPRANALLLVADGPVAPWNAALGEAAQPEDYGLQVLPAPEPGEILVQSQRFLLDPAMLDAVTDAAAELGWEMRRTSVYLANEIALLRDGATAKTIPYSLVAGVETFHIAATSALPPIVLDPWALADLGARRGDRIALRCYRMGADGSLAEQQVLCDLTDTPPSLRTDPLLQAPVPTYTGLTDVKDMADWNPPFPIDMDRIRPQDEAYWDEQGTRPKAFLNLDRVRDLWQGPPGGPPVSGITAVLLHPPALEGAPQPAREIALRTCRKAIVQQLAQASSGLRFRAVRAEALAGAAGSTDFGVLFLSLGFFLLLAAAGLVGLLFRLSVEARTRAIGLLRALGFSLRQVRRLLLAEAGLIAGAGTLVGVPLGLAYAAAILQALRHGWAGAVAHTPLEMHIDLPSLAGGVMAGLVMALMADRWALRALRHQEARDLLAGRRQPSGKPGARGPWAGRLAALALLGAATCLGLWQTGRLPLVAAFLGTGFCALVGSLSLVALRLQGPPREILSLRGLSLRNARREPTRSLLTVGLLACASFLIVIVATNRSRFDSGHMRERSSGAGGFALLARTSLPVYASLASPAGRQTLAFDAASEALLRPTRIYALAESEGESASCLNLNQPQVPKVLGVPASLIERGGFTFAARTPAPCGAWNLLAQDATTAIPAFADAASAQWILKKGLGETFDIPGSGGQPVTLRLVGLLQPSIFAGELLIAEANFRRAFGADRGHRRFLVETPAGTEMTVAAALRENLADFGVDVERTEAVLAGYAGVQNTYLSTFETLGGLGLLLGTFGVVTVLLRHIVERRAELALLTALGFSRAQVLAHVLIENLGLVFLGLLSGTGAALLAGSPQLLAHAAAVNWHSLLAALGLIAGLSTGACWLAARWGVGRVLLAALRSE